MNNNDHLINKILQESKTIAVVGLSPKTERTSHQVAAYLQKNGYRIIPVHPGANQVLGEKSYSRLSEINDPVDLVLVFRRSEFVPEVVQDAIRVKPGFLWLQEGIVHEEAARTAAESGMEVIMDRCMFKEHRRRMRER